MSNPDTWLQDGPLLYRVTDDRHPVNRDEINVTMADGSRDLGARTKRASEILALLAPTEAAAMAATVPADPMDWPLPCAVTVGHGTMGKGVPLRTLVMRMKVLYELATGHNADEVANRTPEQNAALANAFRSGIAQAPVADRPALSDIAEALDLDLPATSSDIITAIGDMRARIYDAEEALLAGQPAEPSPAARADLEMETTIRLAICDGTEQEAFEVWAATNRYDMSQHPLHWLFLNERTWAARDGWKAGIEHALDRLGLAAPKGDSNG